MRSSIFGLPLLFLVLFFSSSSIQAQCLPSLEWSFKAGEKLNVQITQKRRMQYQYLDVAVDDTIISQVHTSWNVLSVDDAGVSLIQMRINRVQWKEEMPGRPSYADIDTDSAGELNDQQTEVMSLVRPLLDAQVEFKMSLRGSITDWKILKGDNADFIDFVTLRRGGLGLFGLRQILRSVVPEFSNDASVNSWKNSKRQSGELSRTLIQGRESFTFNFEKNYKRKPEAKLPENQLAIDYDGRLELTNYSKPKEFPKVVSEQLSGLIVFDTELNRCVLVKENFSYTLPAGFNSSTEVLESQEIQIQFE